MKPKASDFEAGFKTHGPQAFVGILLVLENTWEIEIEDEVDNQNDWHVAQTTQWDRHT